MNTLEKTVFSKSYSKVTINTGDLLVFGSSIENEYVKLYQAGTLSEEQLDEIRNVGLGIL